MNIHLSLSHIAGKHFDDFEKYFSDLNLSNTGIIPALQAASFLKQSGLPDSLLSRIWDMADYETKGSLNKYGFFIALKLISLAQNGKEPSISNLALETPAPKLTNTLLQNSAFPGTEGHNVITWNIPDIEKQKYLEIFNGLSFDADRVAGDKVKPILLQSGLSIEILGKIWDLSDINKDGYLDKHEFIIAFYLVSQCCEGKFLPISLSDNVINYVKSIAGVNLVHSLFPNDINFDNETHPVNFGSAFDFNKTNAPLSESEMILKEIEGIKREKLKTDTLCLQYESDLKLQQAELKIIQRELDHLSNANTQLELQKGEAQKKLDELSDRKTKLVMTKKEFNDKLKEENDKIDQLKVQLKNQTQSSRSIEEEINQMRSDLNTLMCEEGALNEQIQATRRSFAIIDKENQQCCNSLETVMQEKQQLESWKEQLHKALQMLTDACNMPDDFASEVSEDWIVELLAASKQEGTAQLDTGISNPGSFATKLNLGVANTGRPATVSPRIPTMGSVEGSMPFSQIMTAGNPNNNFNVRIAPPASTGGKAFQSTGDLFGDGGKQHGHRGKGTVFSKKDSFGFDPASGGTRKHQQQPSYDLQYQQHLGGPMHTFTESDQVAWATLESKRAQDEAERVRKREEEEFELALQRSKLES